MQSSLSSLPSWLWLPFMSDGRSHHSRYRREADAWCLSPHVAWTLSSFISEGEHQGLLRDAVGRSWGWKQYQSGCVGCRERHQRAVEDLYVSMLCLREKCWQSMFLEAEGGSPNQPPGRTSDQPLRPSASRNFSFLLCWKRTGSLWGLKARPGAECEFWSSEIRDGNGRG